MLRDAGSSARSGSGSDSGSGSAGSSSSANYTANEAEEEAEAEAFAEARFASIERAFAAAKAKGVQSSTRLVKELRALFMAGTFEVELIDDSLLVWEVALHDWAFDPSSPLSKDLEALSEAAGDLVPLILRVHFSADFPFSPPLVYVARPTVRSEYVFDGALCMEMLVDWQPQYGNVESMLVQISAFLAHSGARVETACKGEAAAADANDPAARRLSV